MAVIIINEFLTFVQNKIDVLDEVSIVQICATNFTDSEIEDGKAALYSACSDGSLRNIQRKGDDKRKKNIKDVIKLLKEVDPDVTPTFVAKDLGRLPPVSFDYIDVTRLLKDMTLMRTELTDFKTKFSIELADFRSSLSMHKEIGVITPQIMTTPTKKKSLTPPHTLPLVAAPQPAPMYEKVTRSSNTPTYRGTVQNPSKTLPPVAVPSPTRITETVHTPTYRDIVLKSDRPRQARSVRVHRVRAGQTSVATNQAVRSDTSSRIIEIPSEDKNASFAVVVNKKRKLKKNMRGTLDAECRIQVADSLCFIYVSRAKKSVTVNNILEYISDRGEQCVGVEQLKQNKEMSFNSFKVTIPTSKLGTFLDGGFWPAGLVFRRYKERFMNTAKQPIR